MMKEEKAIVIVLCSIVLMSLFYVLVSEIPTVQWIEKFEYKEDTSYSCYIWYHSSSYTFKLFGFGLHRTDLEMFDVRVRDGKVHFSYSNYTHTQWYVIENNSIKKGVTPFP